MKIKTITCHEVYNYGASLQEYALLKHLENLGHESETIHFKPPYLSKHFKLWSLPGNIAGKFFLIQWAYLLLKLPKRLTNLKRKRNFDTFSEKHIRATKKLYRFNDELKADLPEADAYVCGSDQIWNSYFQNGWDPAFYLDFVPDHKLKLSYAASFAIDSLAEEIKDFVKEKVSRLDHVAVRESSGKKILEDLGFDNVTQVLDPVFLLDTEEWTPLMTSNMPNEGAYLIVYDFDNDPLIRGLAERLKKENGWKIYAFNELISYADTNFYLEGPDVFLALAKNASCILANSFHAVAFSLLFHKNLAVFNRSDKINTRMRDMLKSVGLSEFLIEDQEMADNYKLNTIDFDSVQSKLDVLIDTSKQYLSNALAK